MIKIRIGFTDENEPELEISGHAQAGPRGSDIVCAAVSVLAENLEDSLQTLLGKKPRAEKSPGYHCITLRDSQPDGAAALLFAATALGLRRLAAQYPERIVLDAEKAES